MVEDKECISYSLANMLTTYTLAAMKYREQHCSVKGYIVQFLHMWEVQSLFSDTYSFILNVLHVLKYKSAADNLGIM